MITTFTEYNEPIEMSEKTLREIFIQDSLYESIYRGKFRKRDIRDLYFDKVYPKLNKKDQIEDMKEFVHIRLKKNRK